VAEFVIELAGEHLVDLLRAEIHEVDGVSIEGIRAVSAESSSPEE
jgi:hypothetical protein